MEQPMDIPNCCEKTDGDTETREHVEHPSLPEVATVLFGTSIWNKKGGSAIAETWGAERLKRDTCWERASLPH